MSDLAIDTFPTVWGNIEIFPNEELCFCCNVRKYNNAKIQIVARDVYNLYINGKFICYGPARAAKGYCRIDRIDIDEFLTEDQNCVCVYVVSYHCGTLSFCLEQPLFGAEIRSDGKVIASTYDFECFLMSDRIRKTERMSRQRGFCEIYNDCYSRDRIDFSALKRIETVDVEPPVFIERGVGFSKNTVQQFHKIKSGSVSCQSTAQKEKPLSGFVDFGKKFGGYCADECDVLLSQELASMKYDEEDHAEYGYSVYGVPSTICGIIQIKIQSDENTPLWVIYDDLLIHGTVSFEREKIIHGLKWNLKKGLHTLNSSEVYSGKYIQVICKNPESVQSVSMIMIQNDDPCTVILPEMNADLLSIYNASLNTFRQNSYDIITDCPSRERAGWLCDGYFIGKAEKFFTGCNKVEKNFLENYLLYENEIFEHNGVLPMCYPSHIEDENENIPGWMLWYILELEDFFNRTGDKDFLEKHRARLNLLLDYFSEFENEYGMLENLTGWVLIEWSKASDYSDGVNIPENILYAKALQACGRILNCCDLIEKGNDIIEYIIYHCFNGTVFCDNLVRKNGNLVPTENHSEFCQICAAYFGIIPFGSSFKMNVINQFQNTEYENKLDPTAMFIGKVLRMMMLFRFREYSLMLRECETTFLGMAHKTGTIWESFDENTSCNHGFGAILGMLIVEASIKITEGGSFCEQD